MKKKSPLKVALVGGICKRAGAIFAYGAGWEIWAINAIRPWHLQWARCFNLHRYKHLQRDWHDGIYREAAWANAHPHVPFVVIDPWPKALLPNQVIFPREKLRTLPRGGEYHAGSFDMIVAYAILIGAKEIALHGIGLNMESGEPISARACLEYWCGVAEGRGCKVTIAPDCDLFAQYHLVKSKTVYGYDDVQLVERR